MRYLGYTVEQFEGLDIPDYLMLMDAIRYREADKEFWVHFLAWQNMRARGKKKNGKGFKMAFPKFRMFYDVEKEMKKRDGGKGKSRFSGLAEHMRKWKEGEGDG